MKGIGAIVAAVSLAAALGLGGCAASTESASTASDTQTQSSAYHKIDAEQAKQMIDAGNVTVVDVRRADEYAAGHIAGAINIPNEDIGSDHPAELSDTSADIIVYCRTGVRSKQASDKLVAMGYANIYDMGGITDWPYETTTE